MLYLLTVDAELVMIDLTSGRSSNIIQFGEPSKFDNTLQNSQVVLEKSLIGIYFQDQNNLSVYEIVDEKSEG